jgi:hypothetical protein
MACQFSGSIFGYSGRWNWRKKFPTGYQIINADGTVQFTTIYPGSYDGRVIHIHVKVTPLTDQMKPWNGHRSFTLTIISMKGFILNLHTANMDLST